MSIRIGADVGGTFTDIVIEVADGSYSSAKVLTTHDAPEVGILDGIGRIAAQENISRLRSLYRELFRGGGVFKDRLDAARLSYDNSAEAAQIFAFLDEAGRNGICQAAARHSASGQGS